MVATIKAATIKNKDCKKDVHEAGLRSPPDPVITRWATWLRAALHYSEYFLAVCTIVNDSTGDGLLDSRAKEAINVNNLVPDLVRINKYRTLAAHIEFLEIAAATKAYGLSKNKPFHDDPSSIQAYIKKQSSNFDLGAIILCTNLTTSPTTNALLHKAQLTSATLSDHSLC